VGEVGVRNAAYVIYTSGSTGRPKGVVIEHHSAVTLLRWAGEHFTRDALAGVLASTSVCFDLSVFELFAPLSWGGKIILAENALHLADLKAAEEVSLINTVPSAMAELVRMGGVPASVRTVNLAGEVLQKPLAEQVYAYHGVQQVFNLYGPTEDTTYSTCALVKKGANESPNIGRPIAQTQIYILDAHLQPVPVGVTGELFIGGDGLARGYLNHPDRTAERFIPNPFSTQPGTRLYRTSDLARFLLGGEIEFLGRIDQQVKIRGYRIELGEIEAVLAEHPAVKEVAVAAREDTAAAGDRRLVVYVVGKQETALSISELRDHLSQKLPSFMIPSSFVLLDALPLTPNGKVDRRALPAPEAVRPDMDAAYVEPRTFVEEVLVGIWAEVLGLEQVGVEDNFFELGGHSLLAMQVISRARAAFQIEVALRSLFEWPTVAELAKSLEAQMKAQHGLPVSSIKRVPRGQKLPLSFEQEAWLLHEWWESLHAVENRLFHANAAFRLSGPLNLSALNQALNEIVRRHEVLRTTFPTAKGLLSLKILHPIFRRLLAMKRVQTKLWKLNKKTDRVGQPRFLGGPFPNIAPVMKLTLPVIDLQEMNEREAESLRIVAEESQKPFDYAHGPMLRAILLRLGETEHVLSIVIHHLVTDGWSIQIFMRELTALYQSFAAGSSSPLPELPIQYADFAQWQREWLQGGVLQTMTAYWKRQLAGTGLFPELKLPFARSEPPGLNFHRSGAAQSILVPFPTYQALKELSYRKGVTLYMLLLAALNTLLHRYTDKQHIGVFSPLANRSRAETEGLIGWFAHIHILTTDLSGNPRFSSLLEQVREVVLGAYAHQEIPFSLLLRTLLPQFENYELPQRIFEVPYVFFDFMTQAETAPQMPGLAITPLEIRHSAANTGIEVRVIEQATGLKIGVRYSTDKFDAASIRQMLAHLQTLLESIVAKPEARLLDLPLTNEA
jgi:non-ribosomal peptide synthetase component F/acyl carrier protein